MRKGHNFVRLGLHGRPMKIEGEGGQTQGSGGDNGGGNSGADGSGTGESNNDGQTFDANAFWGNSDDGSSSAPSGESAQSGAEGESGSSDGQSLQEVLTGQLEKMTFGDPVFTAEVAEQINEGNFEGVEARIQSQMRSAVGNSLRMMVSILKPFAEQMTTQMREEMTQTFSSRDDNQTLEQMFPGAKNPAVRPMVQSIYSQALKNTKGDRAEAVKQTKEMLRHAAGVTAGDLDLSVHQRGADDSGAPAKSTNWLDELTSR